MVPSILTFWSVWRKENVESQEKHALKSKFLRTLVCSNHKFNPGYNHKMLIRKVHAVVTRVVLFMNSCFIQYNALLVKYVNVAH